MSGGSSVSTYQYGNQGAADSGAISGIQSIPGAYAASGYSPASTVAAGSNVANSVAGLPSYAAQALTSGFDPQNQAYNQQYQQNVDQTRAGEAARGVAMTPYGAGVENQSNQNFNTNWQMNALQRQQQGASTANSLYSRYAGNNQVGANMGIAGANAAISPIQQQVKDYLAYLSGGTSADNAAVNAQNSNNNSSNSMFSGIGSLVGLGASFIPGVGAAAPFTSSVGGLF